MHEQLKQAKQTEKRKNTCQNHEIEKCNKVKISEKSKTFFGELKRSAYRVKAALNVHGGKGGGREPPPMGVPSSLSAWIEKQRSGFRPSNLSASSTISARFSQ